MNYSRLSQPILALRGISMAIPMSFIKVHRLIRFLNVLLTKCSNTLNLEIL